VAGIPAESIAPGTGGDSQLRLVGIPDRIGLGEVVRRSKEGERDNGPGSPTERQSSCL